MNVDISIIVPSRGRPERLRRLLSLLNEQEPGPDACFEVVVGLDGGEAGALADLPVGRGFKVHCIPLPRVGISAAKNAAVAEARGKVLLFLNDDVEPEPGFVRAHADAHRAGHSIVLGSSPWRRFDDQTVFDEAIARTGMIFFYDRLEPGGHYHFRHAWNLNLSVDRELFGRLDGPFASELRPYMYEDIESAYRLMGAAPDVYYHPTARAMHNHRHGFSAYLRREAMLGVMAPQLFAVNPQCFQAVFRCDLDELVHRARRALDLDVTDAQRSLERLGQLARRPWPDAGTDLDTFYVAHLPLKRRAFRVGLLAAVNHPDRPWQERANVPAEAMAPDEVFQACDPAPAPESTPQPLPA